MTNELTNNQVELKGEVLSLPTIDHSVKGENFYIFQLKTTRLSKKEDILNVVISEKILMLNPLKVGDNIALTGQFRSHNQPKQEGGSHLMLYVFCRDIVDYESAINNNFIKLTGYICRPPIYRITPFTREICDITLAVNRNYNKSDYIPIIAWGRNAKFVESLNVGDQLAIEGRIQSREYTKQVDGETVTKIAYEVSASSVALTENANVHTGTI